MSTTDKYITTHDARADGVYLVEVWGDGDEYRHGIFTTADKARAWMNSLPADFKCVCAPFILDEPDFGNIPTQRQH